MKAILMSIKPKWCEKIFSGKMTIKVCKTAIKLETPFKVYVYCTKERMTRVPSMNAYLHKNEPRACAEYGIIETWSEIGDVIVNPHLASKFVSYGMHGKVIGEFVCDRVIKYEEHIEEGGLFYTLDYEFNEACQLDNWELHDYGKGKPIYAWHISDLKIYDTPRELGEFKTPDKPYHRIIDRDGSLIFMDGYESGKLLTRAPQSWQYVEEVEVIEKAGRWQGYVTDKLPIIKCYDVVFHKLVKGENPDER